MSEPYSFLIKNIASLLESARRTSARSVNAILTATYWEIGRRIVEFDQNGKDRAEYGKELLKKLAEDLTKRFGRGFGVDNLQRFRAFYASYPLETIYATLSRKLGNENYATLSSKSSVDISALSSAFPLSWSHYVRLLTLKEQVSLKFYEQEALRGGWSVRQLDRQISSQFYERTVLSKNKSGILEKGNKVKPEDLVTAEEEIKDPYVLEFLGLKDEYSESDLEEALIHHLEKFLMELGGDFAFIGRQKRLRVGSEWYRVDLLFFHRKLRCLVIIDLKVGKFTHADAGQMHLYLNYAREHWMNKEENPPVGLILCAEKDAAVAKYALEGLPNKVLAREYKLALPQEKKLVHELEVTRKKFEALKR